MRRIEYTRTFERDFRHVLQSTIRDVVVNDLRGIIQTLADDQLLPERYHDHALAGEWQEYRNCHVVYRKSNSDRLQLVRLGSHAVLSF
ncbi:MAG: type II toxin-antitoxin system YafQ family toxin [Firmicutes bacterium]|nr:type II toxin-antitoxin system YafQ family toxin [Bacillota bacterium]MCL5064151.1 type II toxin-antitoxin system YafQ family toxin [Bacillota bacterium]